MEDNFTQTDLLDLEKLIKEYEEYKIMIDKIKENKEYRREIQNQNMKNYYAKNKDKIIEKRKIYNKQKNEEYKMLKNSQTNSIIN